MAKFNKDMCVDEILDRCPESYSVLLKNFGTECFLYPEFKMESINSTAQISGIDPNKLIKEINMLIN